MIEEPEPREGMTPPTLTPEAHLRNISVIAAGLVISPQNPIGTLAFDVLKLYREICDAYTEDPYFPK